MNRSNLRAGVLGVLGCAIAVAYTSQALGTGLLAAIGRGASDAGPGVQWPVLRNAAQEPVGLYGGLVSAYAQNGEILSATLLILPTGYVMPVLSGGETATFAVAYYDQDGCKGREYLVPSDPAGSAVGALLPTRGLVYRTPATDALAYIPKEAKTQPVAVRSRWVLGRGTGQCESAVQTQTLFETRPNETAVTGVDAVVGTGPLALTVEAAPIGGGGGRVRPEKSAEQSQNVRGFTEGLPGEAAMEETPPECSPGCLTEAVGNGICDIACYYPACDHDGGDCATLKPEELAQELAQMCAPGCKRADVGDGFCDTACQNDACEQDGGDCEQQILESPK
ncbi:MAG: hypothetical protein HY941_10350 [Gammaproteobacteria bacterium]|nr:hypothetical protein [Gammaproteobacteria bacterium]